MSPPPLPTENAEKTAEKALERVKILRVFDFVGVVEAVNELNGELQAEATKGGPEEIKVAKKLPPPELPKRRIEIADSDEEEDDAMLFDSPPLVTDGQASVKPPETLPLEALEKVGMILVDNISQVVNLMLKTNYVRGSSLCAFLNNRN